MRLIDADALKKHITEIFETEEKIDKKWAMGLKYSLKIIDNAPTVDCIEFNRAKKLIKQAYQKGKDIRPQGDLISRSEAEKLGATCLARRNENGQLEAIISLDNAPTIDAIVNTIEYIRRGEWIEHGKNYDSHSHRMFVSCECSACHMYEDFPEDDETGNILTSHYCKWCGSNMWKEDNE